jgi:hypothetical protein
MTTFLVTWMLATMLLTLGVRLVSRAGVARTVRATRRARA